MKLNLFLLPFSVLEPRPLRNPAHVSVPKLQRVSSLLSIHSSHSHLDHLSCSKSLLKDMKGLKMHPIIIIDYSVLSVNIIRYILHFTTWNTSVKAPRGNRHTRLCQHHCVADTIQIQVTNFYTVPFTERTERSQW